jgi:hypothetical protein
MRKDIRRAFFIALIYTVIAALYASQDANSQDFLGQDLLLVLFFPAYMAFYLGIMGQSYVVTGILLLLSLLLIWLVVFLIIRIIKFARGKIAN